MIQYEIRIWAEKSDTQIVLIEEFESQKQLIKYLDEIDGFICSVNLLRRKFIF